MKLKKKEFDVQSHSLDSSCHENNSGNIFSKNRIKLFSLFAKRKKQLLIASLIGICSIITLSILLSRPGRVTTVAESSLKEVLQINELSTVEYTYNSIVTVSNEKEDMYHVAYQGIVKAGFDFNEITINTDEKEAIVYIDVPDIKINSVYVDEKSLDFIFINDKYDTETTYQEAYKKSVEDLQHKAEINTSLHEMARENAITTISALIKPWEEQLPDKYTVEYR